MKKIYSIAILSAICSSAFAQWEKRIGLNLLPLSIRSLEVTSEFSPKSCFALTASAGYVNNTAYEGLSGDKVWDGVTERKTSGTFYKLGGRFYFKKYAAVPPKVNAFAGVLLIGSHYSKTGYQEDFLAQTGPKKISKSGFSWGPAFTAGLTFRVNRSIYIDAGIQYGFMINSSLIIGRKAFNYEPGFGASKTPVLIPFVPPLALLASNSQAILALKYQF